MCPNSEILSCRFPQWKQLFSCPNILLFEFGTKKTKQNWSFCSKIKKHARLHKENDGFSKGNMRHYSWFSASGFAFRVILHLIDPGPSPNVRLHFNHIDCVPEFRNIMMPISLMKTAIFLSKYLIFWLLEQNDKNKLIVLLQNSTKYRIT